MLHFKAVMTMSSMWGQRKIVPKQSFREDIGSPQGIETKCLFCVQWGGDVLVSTHVCAIACGLMCTRMWRLEVNSRSCPLKIGISYTGTWSSPIRRCCLTTEPQGFVSLYLHGITRMCFYTWVFMWSQETGFRSHACIAAS